MRYMFINRSNQLRAGWDILMVLVAIFALKWICTLCLSLWTDSGYGADSDGWLRVFKGLGPYILLVIWVAVKVVHKQPLASIGLTRPDCKRLCTCFICGALLLTTVIVIMLTLNIAHLQGDWSNPQWGRVDIIHLFIVSILAGISEEVLCRGYIQHLLSSRLSIYWAVLSLRPGSRSAI